MGAGGHTVRGAHREGVAQPQQGRSRQQRDETPLACRQGPPPLVIGADRHRATAQPGGVAGHRVGRCDPDGRVALERQGRLVEAGAPGDEAHDATGVGDEVLVADAQVVLPAPPEADRHEVPPRPEQRALPEHQLRHDLVVGEVEQRLGALPREGRGPGVADDVEVEHFEARQLLEEQAVGGQLRRVDDDGASHVLAEPVVEVGDELVVGVLRDGSASHRPAQEHRGDPAAREPLEQPAADPGSDVAVHPAGGAPGRAGPEGAHHLGPHGAGREGHPTAAETVVDDAPRPEVTQLTAGEGVVELAEDVVDDGGAAPAAAGEVEDPHRGRVGRRTSGCRLGGHARASVTSWRSCGRAALAR